MVINDLFQEMIKYYRGDAKRIQHFTKVHSYAALIGGEEGLCKEEMFILECAALVNDIGIRECERKYEECGGKLQEKEGPPLAEEMLKKLGAEKTVIDRVCYLVGHHHTYTDIDGLDYQILVEADFLVNMYEDNLPVGSVMNAYERIFKTETGKNICIEMFGLY